MFKGSVAWPDRVACLQSHDSPLKTEEPLCEEKKELSVEILLEKEGRKMNGRGWRLAAAFNV